MARLGAGVIGLGFGRAHARAYRAHPAVELRALCDADPQRLAQAAQEAPGVAVLSDWRALVARPDLDVISVASPDHLHAEMSIAALRAGKHVLCEKPMTPTLREALDVAAAARATGRKFMVGQVCRFAPGFLRGREVAASGEIGRLFFVESEYAHNYLKAAGHGGWRKDPARPRNAFLGGGCHAVDLLRWVAGPMTEVFAYANHFALPDWPVDDCTVALFKFASGCAGKVFCAIGCVRPYTMRSAFYGTEGTVICDNRSDAIQVCSRRRTGGERFEPLPVRLNDHNINGEVEQFVECILADKPVPTDALEGARTVAACLAATESAAVGAPVVLPEVE